jgi:hypothetical protein
MSRAGQSRGTIVPVRFNSPRARDADQSRCPACGAACFSRARMSAATFSMLGVATPTRRPSSTTEATMASI